MNVHFSASAYLLGNGPAVSDAPLHDLYPQLDSRKGAANLWSNPIDWVALNPQPLPPRVLNVSYVL